MDHSVYECPSCRSKDTYPTINPTIRHEFTEIYVSSYCADCGHSYWIIYTPDRVEDRC